MNDVAKGNIFKALEENVFTRESARAFERGTRRGKVRGGERGSTIGITTEYLACCFYAQQTRSAHKTKPALKNERERYVAVKIDLVKLPVQTFVEAKFRENREVLTTVVPMLSWRNYRASLRARLRFRVRVFRDLLLLVHERF